MMPSSHGGSKRLLLPVYDAATRESRLGVLSSHMHALASYRSQDWWQTVSSVKGRNLSFLLLPWVSIVGVSLAWTVAVETGPAWFDRASRALLSLGPALSVVQSALAFLVIFRLARAAQRFWEARQAAGRMIASCRSLASTATAAMGLEAAEAVRRWTAAFPVATKNYLRGPTDSGDLAELAGLLAESDALDLLRAPCQPVWVLDALRSCVAAWAARDSTDALRAHLTSAVFGHLDILTDSFGAMERINNTPLPFVYVAHLRVFLLVFLLAVPLVYERLWKWGTPFATALVAFAFLGLEAAAVECERPFAKDPNHFPFEAFCVVVDANLQQTEACFSKAAAALSPGPDLESPRGRRDAA